MVCILCVRVCGGGAEPPRLEAKTRVARVRVARVGKDSLQEGHHYRPWCVYYVCVDGGAEQPRLESQARVARLRVAQTGIVSLQDRYHCRPWCVCYVYVGRGGLNNPALSSNPERRGQGLHELVKTACRRGTTVDRGVYCFSSLYLCFSFTPRTAFEAYDLSFMSLCLLCLGFGSFSRLRYDFILNLYLILFSQYFAAQRSKSPGSHSWHYWER